MDVARTTETFRPHRHVSHIAVDSNPRPAAAWEMSMMAALLLGLGAFLGYLSGKGKRR